MKYFIVARHPSSGFPIPIVEEDYFRNHVIALFDSFEEAETYAIGHTICDAGGYEIMEWVL